MIFLKKILCGLLCIALLLSSCGQQEAVDIFGENSEIPIASELPLPDEAGGAAGRTLHMNLPEFDTLHPLEAVDEATGNVFSLLFDPGVKVEQDGSCTPNVLESWEYDSQKQEYTFHIRKNVAYSDPAYGTVDAEDMLWALKYMIEKESGALHHYAQGVVSYEKVDALTFTVRTEGGKHNLLLLFSFYVVPKEYYSPKGANTKTVPVGTGAYRVASYTQDSYMLLSRNEDWWKTLPQYGQIELTPVEPGAISLGSDIYDSYELLFSDDITAGSLGIAGKTTVNQIRTPYLSCLVPNVYNQVMEDKNVRKAIAYGIDRTALVSSALMGLGETTMTPLSDNYWAVNCDDHDTAVKNKQKALGYLREAGYWQDDDGRQYKFNSDGTKGYLNIRLMYSGLNDGYNVNRMVAQVIKQQLGEIGITVTLVEKIGEEYLLALQEGSFQLALCQFYTYKDNDVSFLLEEPYNYGRFYSSELEKAMEACQKAVEPEQAIAAYTALQEMLTEKMPVIGLYFQEHCLISDANIVIPEKMKFKQIFDNINQWTDKE